MIPVLIALAAVAVVARIAAAAVSLMHRPPADIDVPEFATSITADEVDLFAFALDDTDDVIGLLEQEGSP